jgi:predicted HTH domain antitoxin
MAITFQLPVEVEEKLRAECPDLDEAAKEAYAVELFRQGKLTHFELSKVLGLGRIETDAFLKRHNVYEGSLNHDDLEADRGTLQRVLAAGRR